MTGEGQFTGSVDQSQTQTISEYHSQDSTEESNLTTDSSESQSSGTQSASESEKGTETSVELLRNFFSVFYTWDLDAESVTKRQELLKGLMSEDLYEQRSIEADSEILKELITTYQKQKRSIRLIPHSCFPVAIFLLRSIKIQRTRICIVSLSDSNKRRLIKTRLS